MENLLENAMEILYESTSIQGNKYRILPESWKAGKQASETNFIIMQF